MATTLEYSVIEDNGGGLHLYVFEGSDCIYAAESMEFDGKNLREQIAALDAGEHPVDDGWHQQDDIHPEKSWEAWSEESRRNGGWKLIYDNVNGPLEAEDMGASGQNVFYPEAER